jgi:hypothetical protein
MFFIPDRRESVEELGSDLEEEKWGRVYISPDGTFRRRQGYRATRSPEDSDLIRRQMSAKSHHSRSDVIAAETVEDRQLN